LACADKQRLFYPLQIVGLVTNRKDAGARLIAKKYGIPDYLVDSSRFKTERGFDRKAYETELKECLLGLAPDWICLAGYMLVLGTDIIRAFSGKIVNIHPSLLPKHKGLRPQQQALEAGDPVTGCTVHFVTEELDGGPVILQKSLPILPEETEESLSRRLLPLEHQTYVEALKILAAQRA